MSYLGIIGLPYAVSLCGFFSGVISLVVVAVVCDFTSRLAISIGSKMGVENYEVLAFRLWGQPGFFLVTLFAVTIEAGALLSYLIVIGDNLSSSIDYFFDESHASAWYTSRNTLILLVGGLVQVPSVLIKNLNIVARLSALNITLMLSVLLYVMILEASRPNHFRFDPALFPNQTQPTFGVVNSDSFVSGVGIISFAFVCHDGIFPVFKHMEDRSERSWARVSLSAWAVGSSFSTMFAIAGYLAFFQTTSGNILNNLGPGMGPVLARMGFSLAIIFTFPIVFFCLRSYVLSLVAVAFGEAKTSCLPVSEGSANSTASEDLHIPEASTARWLLVTVVLMTGLFSAAMRVTNLGAVLGVTGSLGSALLGYVVPALAWLQTQAREHARTHVTSVAAGLVLIFGCVVAVLGSVESLS